MLSHFTIRHEMAGMTFHGTECKHATQGFKNPSLVASYISARSRNKQDAFSNFQICSSLI